MKLKLFLLRCINLSFAFRCVLVKNETKQNQHGTNKQLCKLCSLVRIFESTPSYCGVWANVASPLKITKK